MHRMGTSMGTVTDCFAALLILCIVRPTMAASCTADQVDVDGVCWDLLRLREDISINPADFEVGYSSYTDSDIGTTSGPNYWKGLASVNNKITNSDINSTPKTLSVCLELCHGTGKWSGRGYVISRYPTATRMAMLCDDYCNCISGICQNGGTCTSLQTAAKYQCQCADGYDGVNCDNDLCDGYCKNGGTCSASGVNLKCQCRHGFGGNQCEMKCHPKCHGNVGCSFRGKGKCDGRCIPGFYLAKKKMVCKDNRCLHNYLYRRRRRNYCGWLRTRANRRRG